MPHLSLFPSVFLDRTFQIFVLVPCKDFSSLFLTSQQMKLYFYFHRRLLLHVTMFQMRAEIGISNFKCPPSQSSSIFTRTRSPFFWQFVTEVSLHADSYYYYCSLVMNLATVLYRTIAFHCSSPLNA